MMHFKHISLLAAALAMLVLGGCKKPEQGQEQGQEQEQPKPTPTPVEVEGKITITTGPLDATVASAVEAYDGDVDRTADVTITCGKDSKKLTVTQKAKDPGDDPGDDPGSEPIPGEGDELPCLSPPAVGTVDPTALVGYGAVVTGGEGSGGNVLHFNSGKALQTWLLQRTKDEKKGNHTPTVIWLSGTFKSDEGRDFSEAHPWFDVKDVSNLSFIGTDDFVMDKIGRPLHLYLT